jgi:formamidopyrimidine-DNA glycosylase
MPELPEVQTVLDGVVRSIQGKRIQELRCLYPGTVVLDPENGPEPFPASVTASRRRGKYMILHLDSGHSLIIHLRMTGKLVHSKGKAGTDKHERACFLLSGREKLHFIDIRTFGKIILCRTANVESYLPSLGVEPLSADFTPAYLAARLKGRSAPIKNSLLDQSVVAGLGNIYVCEVLYRCGIRPDKPSRDLGPKQLKLLVKHTREVLAEAIAMNGTSVSDFRRVDDKTGEFQNYLRVYQKSLCPRGHEVDNIRLAGRSSFFCPLCQK